ncbi:hypothetical protein Chls_647 [Chlamydia suis]|uniref:Uncharacterized protein n=1 Tax=Chlamydia suis TaxID=83559 RepID=A0ABX6IUD5_9CHLA|nr:hypothetical protein Chls_647 [Chlamydia suis]
MCSDDATKPKPIFPPIIGSYAQDVREGGVAAVAATIRMIWVGGGGIFSVRRLPIGTRSSPGRALIVNVFVSKKRLRFFFKMDKILSFNIKKFGK